MLLRMFDSGYATLANQKATGTPVEFTHFAIGDAVSFTFDPSRQEPYGNTVFTSEWPQLTYTSHTEDCVILRCLVEHDDPQLVIGNLVLYANEEAFCLCYSLNKFDKLVTIDTGAGCRWMLQIYLRIKDLMNRCSFDALIEDSAEIRRYANEREINFPHGELHDQAVISRHTTFNKPIPLMNVQNEWYGHALARRMNDNRYNVISGGAVGDRYRYDPDTEKIMPSFIRVYMQRVRALVKRMGYISYGTYSLQTSLMTARRIWELGGTTIAAEVSGLETNYSIVLTEAAYELDVSAVDVARRQSFDYALFDLYSEPILLQYYASLSGCTIDTFTYTLDAYRRVDFILSEFVVSTHPIKLQYAAELEGTTVDTTVSGIFYSWLDPIAVDTEIYVTTTFDINLARVSPVTTQAIGVTFNDAHSLGRKKAARTGTYAVTTGSLSMRVEKKLASHRCGYYVLRCDVYRKAEMTPVSFETTISDVATKYNRIVQLNRAIYTRTPRSINTDLRFYIAFNHGTVETVPVSIAVRHDRAPALVGTTFVSIGEDIDVTLT